MMNRPTFWLFTLMMLSNNLFAEIYTSEVTYKPVHADDKTDSRILAFDQVKTLLLDKIGSHIQQTIKINEVSSDHAYARNDVEAITANLTEINILDETWDGDGYYIKAEVDSDIQPVLDALKIYKIDFSDKRRQSLKALKINEKALQKSREKISRLRKNLQREQDNNKSKVVKEYKNEIQKLATEEVFATAFKFQQQGNMVEAIKRYREIAKKGNAVAQQLLGTLYMRGEGTEQDYNKAVFWLRKAAEQDESIAQYYLGMLYLKGNGFKKDISKAVDWLHKSAQRNDDLAQYQLGILYLHGNGVEQQNFMAAHWFRLAAEHQLASAQLQLGKLYASGKGLAKNDNEALLWYKKAAAQGLTEAKALLKQMNTKSEN